MKKLLSIFAVVSLLFGITTAATGDLRSWLDNLSTEIPFWYLVSQKISVDSISSSKIVVRSPVIVDEQGNKITKYTVMVSKYPLSQILENTTLLDQSKEKTFEFTTMADTITMDLSVTWDALDLNTYYYLSIIPKDKNNILGEISNELRFKLAIAKSGEWSPSDSSVVHSSAGADMSLANITHTITSNRATLRRTAVDGSDKVDIFLWNPTSSVFERLSSVNMSDESYTFTLSRNGEYIVNFMPNNWGKEYRYTFVANWIVATTTPTTPTTYTPPTIKNIPATWPKENVLVALGIALVIYLIYRSVKSKAKR